MNSDTNPFKNAIQLEEIIHFERPTKSILNIHKSFQYKIPKRVSYSLKDEDQSEEDDSEYDRKILESNSSNNNLNPPVSPVSFSNSSVSNQNPFIQPKDENSISNVNKNYDEPFESESESESDTEFHRNPHENSKFNNNDNSGGFRRGMNETISDENLFPLPSIQLTNVDFLFACIVLIINLGELVCDSTLAVWHFQNNQKWDCGLTLLFMGLGGIGMLHQFSLLQVDQLQRLFRKAKRVRILVNCFPPAANIFVSFENVLTAWRAHQDPMVSQQFFQIHELSRSLSRVQSFFQAAPQATLQLIILIEKFDGTSWEKVMLTLLCITLSLIVMTNANLPSKTDIIENTNLQKAAYLPWTRVFVGMRMFSSLGSRCMALTYLFVGCKCLLDADTSSSFVSIFIGIILLVFPRLVFTLTDYVAVKVATRRNLEHYREQPEIGISSSHPISKIPFADLFFGYLATIFFPVGDPLWLFWYLWAEGGIFIIFGNVAGMTHGCMDHGINVFFTGLFFIVFVIVPVIIPYTKILVHRQKIRKFNRVLQIVEDANESIANYGRLENGNHDRNQEIPTTNLNTDNLHTQSKTNVDLTYERESTTQNV